jgi:hypothetical protein
MPTGIMIMFRGKASLDCGMKVMHQHMLVSSKMIFASQKKMRTKPIGTLIAGCRAAVLLQMYPKAGS